MNGKVSFYASSYEDQVVLDLENVEDYSRDSSSSTQHHQHRNHMSSSSSRKSQEQDQTQQLLQPSHHHDQLPAVEEIRLFESSSLSSRRRKTSTLRKKRRTTTTTWKCFALGMGFMLVLLGVAAVVFQLATNQPVLDLFRIRSSDSGSSIPTTANPHSSTSSSDYYERLINDIALNATSDFQDKYSYQSIAKRWLLKDTEILLNATVTELEQRYALYCILLATDGVMWMPSKNIPECRWDGVTCAVVESSRVVTRLNLRNTHLQGDLPDEILLLKHLQVLNLKANHDLKSIPLGLCDGHSIEIKANCEQIGCKCCSECGT